MKKNLTIQLEIVINLDFKTTKISKLHIHQINQGIKEVKQQVQK